MAFKMRGWSGSPMSQNSPMKQGGLVECPECNWSIEATNDPGYDQMLLMDHVQDAHMGGSTGPGTPGYHSPSNPGGWSGDTPTNAGGPTRADRRKTRGPQ